MHSTIPSNLKYTREHEWVRVEGQEAYVGITHYAQNELGDIIFVQIKTVGETLAAGDFLGVVEAVKTTSDIFMPVGGTVLECNEALEDAPELVNQNPYEEGWIVKIAINDLSELSLLLTAEEYESLLG